MNGGLECYIRYHIREIGYGPIGERGGETQISADVNARALESLAGGNDGRIEHQGVGKGAEELLGRFLRGGGGGRRSVERDSPAAELSISAHLCVSM